MSVMEFTIHRSSTAITSERIHGAIAKTISAVEFLRLAIIMAGRKPVIEILD